MAHLGLPAPSLSSLSRRNGTLIFGAGVACRGKGLGKNEEGIQKHITAKVKNDALGVCALGCTPLDLDQLLAVTQCSGADADSD